MLPPTSPLTGTTIVSAATITVPVDGLYFDVTGSVGITSMLTNGRAIGAVFTLRFAAACPITNNTTTLILKDKVNAETYTTSANEYFTFIVVGTNQVREIQSRFMPLQSGTVSTNQTLAFANRALNVSGAITITIPTAVGRAGEELWFVKTDANTTTVSFLSNGGNMGGLTTRKMTLPQSVMGLRSNGTNWDIIEHKAPGVVPIMYAATITPDCSILPFENGTFETTLTGNVTIAAPTNPVDGQEICIILVQDATGSRTLTWNAVFAWNVTFPLPTASTVATRIDQFRFKYRAATVKWVPIGVSIGS